MKLIPAADDASRDPALTRTALTVYRTLLETLHPLDWHEVKQAALALQTGLHLRTVEAGVALLIARRYIEREPAKGSVIRRYRLVYSRSACDDVHSRNPAA